MKYFTIFIAAISLLISCSKDNNTNPTTNPTNNFDTVTIGTQVWMMKNLDVDHYRNGDPIPQVTDGTLWSSLTTGAWCYYNNSDSLGAIYGKLYNWYAVNDSRGLAPAGWHVTSDSDWTVLTTYLGDISVAGGIMKETGTSHWQSPNSGATNSSGFSALPGGYRNFIGIYTTIGYYGVWWSSTEHDKDNADSWYLYYLYTGIYRNYNNDKQTGFSVRCVRD